jgi:hypothetical protein
LCYLIGMKLLGIAYREALRRQQRRALTQALDILLDEWFNDLETLEHGENFEETLMADNLPRRYLLKYDRAFARKFLTCLATVGWKLAQPEHYPLQCVGEELAAMALIEEAKACLELDSEAMLKGKEKLTGPLDELVDLLFEDTDILFLFQEEFDGIDISEVGAVLGMTSLTFSDWFTGFTSWAEGGLHPYYVADSIGAGPSRRKPMPLSTLGEVYRQMLTIQEQEALVTCIPLLLNDWFADLVAWHEEKSLDRTKLAMALPEACRSFITPVFAKAFLLCLSTVAWKLAQPQLYSLSNVAEQLAARALLARAKEWVKTAGHTEVPAEQERTPDMQAKEDGFVALEKLLFGDKGIQLVHEAQSGRSAPSIPRKRNARQSLLPEMVGWFKPIPIQQATLSSEVHPYHPD